MYIIELILFILLVMLYLITMAIKNKKRIYIMKLIYIVITFTIYITYIIIRIISVPIRFGVVSSILGVLLLISEIMGYIAFCTYITIFKDKYEIEKKGIDCLKGQYPSVDVLICTYNEEISLLEKTIVASKRIKYPEGKIKVYVLDDGKNNRLKKLCESLDVNYISRDNNEFAKAGNINNALNIIDGEYFLVLDADMIPYPNILERTMGYFCNKNLAFVQTPQTFYNPDVFQYNISKEFNNEQDFFMRYIEQARASKDAVLHVGTNAIFNRSYVLKVGGYPTSSITEDMALGLLLQAEGYDSIFVNEELACGMSATTYSDLVKQRDRWCRGNLQVVHNYKKVIRKKLDSIQKTIYFDGVLYWLSGITKTIFLVMPVFGFLGIPIVDRFAGPLIPLFFLSFISQIMLSKIILPKKISKHYFRFFSIGNIYNTVMAPHLAFSVIKHYTHSNFKFNVTNKDCENEKAYYNWRLALPHIVLCLLIIISFCIAIFKLSDNSLSIQAFLINLFWSLYNIPGLICSLKIAYQPPRSKMESGIEIDEDINILLDNEGQCLASKIKKISENGIKIIIKEADVSRFKNIKYDRVFVNNKWIDVELIKIDYDSLEYKYYIDSSDNQNALCDLFLKHLRIYVNNLKYSEDE